MPTQSLNVVQTKNPTVIPKEQSAFAELFKGYMAQQKLQTEIDHTKQLTEYSKGYLALQKSIADNKEASDSAKAVALIEKTADDKIKEVIDNAAEFYEAGGIATPDLTNMMKSFGADPRYEGYLSSKGINRKTGEYMGTKEPLTLKEQADLKKVEISNKQAELDYKQDVELGPTELAQKKQNLEYGKTAEARAEKADVRAETTLKIVKDKYAYNVLKDGIDSEYDRASDAERADLAEKSFELEKAKYEYLKTQNNIKDLEQQKQIHGKLLVGIREKFDDGVTLTQEMVDMMTAASLDPETEALAIALGWDTQYNTFRPQASDTIPPEAFIAAGIDPGKLNIKSLTEFSSYLSIVSRIDSKQKEDAHNALVESGAFASQQAATKRFKELQNEIYIDQGDLHRYSQMSPEDLPKSLQDELYENTKNDKEVGMFWLKKNVLRLGFEKYISELKTDISSSIYQRDLLQEKFGKPGWSK